MTVPALLRADVSVSFPDAVIDGVVPKPDSVYVVDEVNKHVYIEADFTGVPEQFGSSLLSGSPMRVSIATRAGRKDLFGYVVGPTPKVQGADRRTTITALGITYPMKVTSGKVWGPQPISKTMSEIIYRHGLTPYVEDTGIYQTVPQAGRSDWEVLRDLAGLAGLSIFVTGTTVNVLSPEGAYRYFFDEAGYLQRRSTRPGVQLLDGMHRMDMTTDQVQRSAVNASSVDPDTARVFTFRAEGGLFVNQGQGITARSPATLKTKVSGARRKVAYPMTMEVEGPGNPLVGAGKPVFVNNDGVGNWWLTKRVEHTFSPRDKSHTMVAELRATGGAVGYPTPPKGGQRGLQRELPNYCFCREYDPVLVGASRAGYVTSQSASPGTYPEYQWNSVEDWVIHSPIAYASPTAVVPFGGWESLRRWRSRGRCPG